MGFSDKMSAAMDLEIALEEANPLMRLDDSGEDGNGEPGHTDAYPRMRHVPSSTGTRSQIAPVQELKRMDPSRQNSGNCPPMKSQMKYPI